jgi:uncharacterized RDD family membrane protein YckC
MARAGFVSRFAAFVLDWLILAIASGVGTTMVRSLFEFFGLNYFRWGRYALVGATMGTASVLSFLFLAVMWHLVGCSPGKALVGLRVVRKNGRFPTLVQAIVRLLGYWVSSIPFFLGFVWSLFDASRRTWHDMLSRTYVVYAPAREHRAARAAH